MSGASVLSWQQYEAALDPLTKELSDAARWIQETGQRVVILFEGRDTAGKGGSIDMFARTLNPRQCRVVALTAPSGTGVSATMRRTMSSALAAPRWAISRWGSTDGTRESTSSGRT